MPPRIDSMGLGGQSVGDFLNVSDTPTLRSKYYDTLQAGLDSASTPAQPDQGNVLWQGIIPALAMALLTKGKSAAFSGGPMLNVLANEQKRADDSQKLTVEAKLKGAGLFGDELGRRETLATATANKEEDRALRKETHADSIAMQKESLEARMENASATRALAQSNREFQQNMAGTKEAESETKDLKEGFDKELKARGLDESYDAVNRVSGILKKDQITNVDMQAVKEALTRALIHSRPANVTMDNLLPKDATSRVTSLMNDITSGAENPISPDKMQAVRDLVKVLQAENAMAIGKVYEGLKNSPSGRLLKQRGEFDKTVGAIGGSYGVGNPGSNAARVYTLPSGKTVTGQELTSQGYDIDTLVQQGKLK